MAGHTRTVDTGTVVRSATGRVRKLRQHLPPGETAGTARAKNQQGARALADHKIRRAADPLRQLDLARDYVRSATAKYEAGGEIADAIETLLAAGDRIYLHGRKRR